MPRVGVRELKNRTSEILRAVGREKGEYIIACHGRPAAILLPIAEGDVEDNLLAHRPRSVKLREEARHRTHTGRMPRPCTSSLQTATRAT